jgi:DNA-binding CsgD family transcriptional regulator
MFQYPENLESQIGKVDTTNISDFEQARLNTIKALLHFNNEEYGLSIKALEKAESYYLKHGDDFHNHINQLIKAFDFEYLDLKDIAANLYIECEDYFAKTDNPKYKFYASIGVLRMSKQLNLDKLILFDRLKTEVAQLKDPVYNALLYATMGVLEKNDSIKSLYYQQAKSDNYKIKRWSRVYAIELNELFWEIWHNKIDDIQTYYDNFNNKSYSYTPSNRERLRYQYAQAYLFSIQGKNTQAIIATTRLLDQAVVLKISKVESDCLQLLAYLYEKTGNFKDAHEMLVRYHQLKEKTAGILQQNRFTALGAHYHYTELEKDKLNLKIKHQRTVLISGSALFILFVILSLLWHKKEILKRKYVEVGKQIDNLIYTLDREKNKNAGLITQLENLKVQHHTQELAEFIQLVEQKQITKWVDFESNFLRLKRSWVENIKQQVPELTPSDLRYCMCLYFNMNNQEIADYLYLGNDAIKTAKRRLRDKFSLEEASEISIYLKKFDDKQ